MLKVAQAAFVCDLFLRLVRHPRVLGLLQMTLYLLDKQTASCNSLHDWLMSLAINLVVLSDMWG